LTDLNRTETPVGADTPFGPYIRQYLGRRVRVTLDLNAEAGDQRAAVTGTLVHATDDGDVTVRAEDGTNHYAWPALRIEILDPAEDQR
jgi:hypothetical protein